jgi:hypothetical protein
VLIDAVEIISLIFGQNHSQHRFDPLEKVGI